MIANGATKEAVRNAFENVAAGPRPPEPIEQRDGPSLLAIESFTEINRTFSNRICFIRVSEPSDRNATGRLVCVTGPKRENPKHPV